MTQFQDKKPEIIWMDPPHTLVLEEVPQARKGGRHSAWTVRPADQVTHSCNEGPANHCLDCPETGVIEEGIWMPLPSPGYPHPPLRRTRAIRVTTADRLETVRDRGLDDGQTGRLRGVAAQIQAAGSAGELREEAAQTQAPDKTTDTCVKP